MYGSGVDTTGAVHFYGLGLARGEVVLDVPVAEPDRCWDALDNGNNTIINDDGSASWATFGGFVRITPRQ